MFSHVTVSIRVKFRKWLFCSSNLTIKRTKLTNLVLQPKKRHLGPILLEIIHGRNEFCYNNQKK